ncbi:alpha/beta hydrolase [Helicobacter pylori]
MIRKLLTIASASVLASYVYTKVKAKRSYPSFLFETMFRLSGMKKTFSSIEDAQVSLEKIKTTTKGEYEGTSYHFNNEVVVQTIDNSSVYVVNAQENRQQNVILYIHGGAWYQDPLKHHFEFIDLLASSMNAKVIMPIYPKVPHADYQQTFNLLMKIYKQIINTVESAHQITIMGDSAGGQISLSFAQYLKQEQLLQPSNIVLISPVLDATFSNPEAPIYEKVDPMLGIEGSKFFTELWANDLPLTDWRVSPINGDLEGLGHITIVIGTKETIYPDSLKLSQMLNRKNIKHDFIPGYNLFHIFPIFPIPERQQTIEQLKCIIGKY